MQNFSQSYLETQVYTATPQRLQLMLIEGAIRLAGEALSHLDSGSAAGVHRAADETAAGGDAAAEAIIRCREIVTHILVSIRPAETGVSEKTAGIYLFLFQHLTDAQRERNAGKLREAIEVLEEERQTWVQVCEQFPDPLHREEPHQSEEVSAAGIAAIPTETDDSPMTSSGGFSLEA